MCSCCNFLPIIAHAQIPGDFVAIKTLKGSIARTERFWDFLFFFLPLLQALYYCSSNITLMWCTSEAQVLTRDVLLRSSQPINGGDTCMLSWISCAAILGRLEYITPYDHSWYSWYMYAAYAREYTHLSSTGCQTYQCCISFACKRERLSFRRCSFNAWQV